MSAYQIDFLDQEVYNYKQEKPMAFYGLRMLPQAKSLDLKNKTVPKIEAFLHFKLMFCSLAELTHLVRAMRP